MRLRFWGLAALLRRNGRRMKVGEIKNKVRA